MWKQTKGFNQGVAGKTAGYCLRNVRQGYGVNSKYATANQAWSHTVKHQDRNIPGGVDVPLFYSYQSDGHVNVRLASGQVWTDGRLFPNLDGFLAWSKAKYLGWGETLNDVRVIEYAPDPAPSSGGMPSVGQVVHLAKGQNRTVFVPGTNTVRGIIHVTDDSFNYVVRGIRSNRIVMNSASLGGQVEMALYYVSGARIDGWSVL